MIAGWRGGQIAVVAFGAVMAVAVLHHRPTLPTVVLAVVLVAACVALVWWPVAGRTPEQWLPTVVRWGASGLVRGRRTSAGGVGGGHCIGADGLPCLLASQGAAGAPTVAPAQPPTRPGRSRHRGSRERPSREVRGSFPRGPFTGLHVVGFAPHEDDATLGIVHDHRARTYTAVLELLGHSFALLSGDDKDRRVASWASVLSSLARDRSTVHRVQWVAVTMPDDGAAVDDHFHSRRVLPASSPACRSYATLLRGTSRETCRHDVYLAIQLRATGATARAMRPLGGGERAACSLLAREVASLRRQLASADIPVERVLDERGLAALARRSLDGDRGWGELTGVRGGGGERRCPPCGVGWPWPLSTAVEWDALRADGSWHATYWISEWPRVDVGPEFLGPLLVSSVRRTVAVVMEPLPPGRAARQAERARTADIADSELRRRGGFLATARRAREAEVAVRREEELADGHASFRFSGYVSVSAPSRDELAAACDSTEQAASQCHLEVRRLYGEQEEALSWTLPLARGLS